MHELDDHTLLRQYAEQNSETAFAALVARHVDKVYSVALRHTRNAQAVFVILAKKSGRLGAKVILAGWLYETARLTAVTFIRSEIRRAHREQEAHMQTALNENDADAWPHIAPLLDDALAGLSAADRHAVVLRYFDGKSLGEVGAALGASEDAAKKRVTRAVDKLRGFFTKRGVTLTATVLTTAISANSVQAAPLGLAATVTATAVKGAVVSGSTLTLIKGALKVMAWTKMKTAIVVGVGAVLVGTGVYKAQQVAKLREQNQTLQQAQGGLAEQMQDLETSLANATNRLTELMAENSRLKTNPAQNELLKLRGQNGVLRQQLTAAINAAKKPSNNGIIATNQLQFVGYATPDQAFQSLAWAVLNGDYGNWLHSYLDSERQQSPDEFTESKFRIAQAGFIFNAIEPLASKSLADNQTELKVRFHSESGSVIFIIPYSFVDGEYKIKHEFRTYKPDWEKDGTIQKLGN